MDSPEQKDWVQKFVQDVNKVENMKKQVRLLENQLYDEKT